MQRKIMNLLPLVSVTALFLFIQLGNPLAGGHSDEPLYIGIARDMMIRHDWVLPTLHGKLAFYKPPLLYWMMMISFKIFHQSSLFAARFPAALCGVIAVFFTVLLGEQLFLERQGKLAGWLTATTVPGLYAYARAALMDIPLVCFMTASLYFFVRAAKEKKSGFLIPAFLCFALTSLLKGPVGLLIPVLPVLWIFYREKSWRLLLTWQGLLGVVSAIFIVLWWPIAVYTRGEWNAWVQFFIVQENLGKFNRQFDPTTHATPGRVVWIHLLSQFMPWSFFLIASCFLFLIKKENRNLSVVFLLLWIASVVFIFLLPEKKLSHYTLPAIPATALLVAALAGDNVIASLCTAILTAVVGLVLLPLSGITSGIQNTALILLSSCAFLYASYSLFCRRLQHAAYGLGIFLIFFAFGLPHLMSTLNVNDFKEKTASETVIGYKIDLAILGSALHKEIPYVDTPEGLQGKQGLLVLRERDETELLNRGIKLSSPLLSWTAWKDHIRILELFHAIRTRDREFLNQPIVAVKIAAVLSSSSDNTSCR